MAGEPVFPAFTKIEHQPNPQAEAAFQAEVERMLGGAGRKLDDFSAKARETLDKALSVDRNRSGSLDIGVDQLNAAAQAQMQRAMAAREVYEATVRAAQAEGAYSVEVRQSIAATKALWQEEERAAQAAQAHARAASLVQQELNRQKSATDLVQQATRKGTTEQQNVINSIRASRTAYVQLGQQMQDIVVQAQLGTNAFLIFAQQAPQAAFALSGLERSTNATQAAIGRFATFLSGPWGAAIFAATAVLGPFIYNLFESGSAADESARAQRTLTQVLNDQTSSYQEVTAALREYNREQERARETTLLSLAAQAEAIRKNLEEAVSIREKLKARIADNLEQAGRIQGDNSGGTGARAGVYALASVQQAQLAEQDVLIKDLAEAASNVKVQVADRIATINSDQSEKIKEGFDILRTEAKNTIKDIDQLTARLTTLNKQEKAALDALKSSDRKPRDTSAAAGRLAEFGEDAEKKIANIRDRFIDIPPAVQQSNRAIRELDDIISDLERRKPKGFEALVDEAERLKEILPGLAETKAFDELNRVSEQNLQIQRLMVAGRVDEANALQTIWRLEKELGPLTADRRQEVLDLVSHERAVTEELQRQQQVINYYLDATRSVRNELEAIFSGRGSIGNLQQVFKDLQGKVLVDKIFGDSLKQLDDLISGRSGVQMNIDFLASESNRAGTSLSQLADTVIRSTERIAAATSEPATFDQAFSGNWLGAANDNTGPNPDGSTDIVVAASRMSGLMKSGAMGMTPAAYAELMAKAVAMPIVDALNETFDTQFFSQLGGALQGALVGYVTAGVPGGILGAFKGLNDERGLELFGEETAKRLSEVLDPALKGMQTGTMVSGLAGAFGLDLGTTGSQIGGAIGSFLPIPGGDIIGAIAGGIIEKILGGIKKGTVTINGADITSTYGGNDDRIQAATTGANSVLDSIERIAEALGADVNSAAGAVSIGIRKDSWRVDPTGRNLTKIEDGAIDFGQDQAAAIRYAIMDLIKDGVIDGLRDSTMRLLQAGDDLEKALQKALDFENVFTRLKAYKDPVGAAIDEVEKEFDRLREIFAEAGASAEEYAQLEELYGIERAKAIEEATQAVVGSLQSLLDDLTVNNSALSLRERESLAKAEYDALAARVAAGDTTAYDDFADAARTLLEIEREIYGSQQPYFDLLNEVTTLTRTALEAAENRSDPSSTSAVPVNDNSAIVSGIDTTNSQLAAVNQNIGATNVRLDNLTALLASGSGSAKVSNF